MTRLVLLLRAVNVGGRTLSMPALREAFTAAGCERVETYIQSGNVVLDAPPGRRREWFEQVAGEVAGYEVSIVVRTAAELRTLIADNPYLAAGGTALHVVFFDEPPPRGLLVGVDLAAVAPEHATLRDRHLYLHLPHGMGRARLPLLVERARRQMRPPVVGTARNWNTVCRLADLADLAAR